MSGPGATRSRAYHTPQSLTTKPAPWGAARVRAFVEALVIQAAAALGSERYLAADDAHYVTVNDYRGAAVDIPFQRERALPTTR